VDVEPVALRLAHGLARAAVALDATGFERNLAQQLVLLHLRRRFGGCALDDLATELGLAVIDLQAAVGTLVREGLLTMSPAPSYAPHDVRVELTGLGRAQPPELLNWAAELLTEIDRLDEEDQLRLFRLVQERIAAMQGSGQIPVAKMCISCRYFSPYAHAGTAAPHHCHLVGVPFGHHDLRLRCPEQQPAG
jgi:DNA-binding MarR family transcriptional regulator